jgi:hypothetical protein
MEELYKNYGFPSVDKFVKILKDNGIKLPYAEIDNFVKNNKVYQLHKANLNIKSKQKFAVALKPYNMVQIDLIDYQKYSRNNKGYKYIFVGIDVFSRKAFADFIKSKTPTNLLNAFKSWNIKPSLLYHDAGNEFKGVFNEYCDENNILNYNIGLGNHKALGVVDRLCKTLKGMLSKYMTDNNTTNIYDILSIFVNSYNDTPHSSLNNHSPNSIFKDETAFIDTLDINEAKRAYNNYLFNKTKIKFKIGDKVRIKIDKPTFSKGYNITYSKRIYTIINISGTIATLNNNDDYYFRDLQKINRGEDVNMDDIEKAEKDDKIKRRMRREGLI